MNERLIEAWVHHERNELYAILTRGRDDARVHLAGDRAEAVEREDLRGYDGDLRRMGDEALRALFAARRIPQRLELLRVRARNAGTQKRERECAMN